MRRDALLSLLLLASPALALTRAVAMAPLASASASQSFRRTHPPSCSLQPLGVMRKVLVHTVAVTLPSSASLALAAAPEDALAPLNLPSSAVAEGSTVMLGGLLQEVFREPTDVYYFVLVAIGLGLLVKDWLSSIFQAAKAADDLVEEKGRAGAQLANKLEAERLRKKREAAREAVLKAEPATYERMQAEKRMRDDKRSNWKVFGDDE